jgi:hypothetical protein
VLSNLIVYSPEELKQYFANADYKITANYANFGYIPYGQSMIGRIYYNESNPYGCDHDSGFIEN